MGKSFIFEEYRLRHPPVVEDEVTRTPVVHVKIPSSPTKKDIFATLLEGIGAHIGIGTAAKYKEGVEALYRATGVEFICVDEVQHLIDDGDVPTLRTVSRPARQP